MLDDLDAHMTERMARAIYAEAMKHRILGSAEAEHRPWEQLGRGQRYYRKLAAAALAAAQLVAAEADDA